MGLAALSADMSVSFAANAQNSANGFPNASWSPTISSDGSVSLGTTTAGQANLASCFKYTIAASGSQTINLQSITDVLGTWDYVRVKEMVIYHDAASLASSIKWDSTVTHSFLGWLSTGITINLQAGEVLPIGGPTANGRTVSGTTNIITLTNNDSVNEATVWFGIIGADA